MKKITESNGHGALTESVLGQIRQNEVIPEPTYPEKVIKIVEFARAHKGNLGDGFLAGMPYTYEAWNLEPEFSQPNHMLQVLSFQLDDDSKFNTAVLYTEDHEPEISFVIHTPESNIIMMQAIDDAYSAVTEIEKAEAEAKAAFEQFADIFSKLHKAGKIGQIADGVQLIEVPQLQDTSNIITDDHIIKSLPNALQLIVNHPDRCPGVKLTDTGKSITLEVRRQHTDDEWDSFTSDTLFYPSIPNANALKEIKKATAKIEGLLGPISQATARAGR